MTLAGVSAAAHRIEVVVRLVADDPGLTSQDVAERIDVSRRHASLLLLRLEELGLVAHHGRRWFPGGPTAPRAGSPAASSATSGFACGPRPRRLNGACRTPTCKRSCIEQESR